MTEQKDDKVENSSAQKSDDFRVVSVKLRASELAELDALCAEIGVKRNRAMRSLVLKASGFVEYDDATTKSLKDLTRQISGIATNINQLAKLGNRTGSPDFVAFMEDRKGLGRLLSKVESKVQILLNVKKRKADAAAMLRRAIKDG